MADPYVESSSEFSESEDEGFEDYRKGGYHAIRVGDSFRNGRYVVQRKLGWGQFSTVWLAWDNRESRYVALKVQKSAQHFTEAALDEIAILKAVADKDPEDKKSVVKLLDSFKHSGPNGQHVCMVFEYLGDSLLSLIKYTRYRGLPLDIVRKLSRNILVGLDYLHREMSIIHTDLKPENILLYSRIDPSKDPRNSEEPPLLAPPLDIPSSLSRGGSRKDGLNGVQMQKLKRKARRATSRLVSTVAGGDIGNTEVQKLLAKQASYSVKIGTLRAMDLRCKIVDVGNACWVDKKITNVIQTRQYRAPEVILGAPYSMPVDMWSFACIAFELATGDTLFDIPGFEGLQHDEDQLALMMELLGKMPRKIALGGNNSREFFDRYGDLKRIRRLRFWTLDRILVEKYRFSEKDADEFAKFLLPLLDFAPEKRPTAEKCLKHPWIKCETGGDDPVSSLSKTVTNKNDSVSSNENSVKQSSQTESTMRDNSEKSEVGVLKTVNKEGRSGIGRVFGKADDILVKQKSQHESPRKDNPENSEMGVLRTLNKEGQSGISRVLEKAEVGFKKLVKNVEQHRQLYKPLQKSEHSTKKSPVNEDGVKKSHVNEALAKFDKPAEKADTGIKKLATSEGQSGFGRPLEKPEVSINKLPINEGQSSWARPRMFVSDIHLRASRC